MSLEIKVDPESIKVLIEESRKVPSERVDQLMNKIDCYESTLSSWKGDAKPAHDEVCDELRARLRETKALMESIIASLDHAVDDFKEADHQISESFANAIESYKPGK